WWPSGCGSRALPTTRFTGAAISSSSKMARSAQRIRCPNLKKVSLPRRSRSRTKFPLIGKHQLASPFRYLACPVLDVSRQSKVLRAFVARRIVCDRVFCGEQKDCLLALPKPCEGKVVIKDLGRIGELGAVPDVVATPVQHANLPMSVEIHARTGFVVSVG